MNFVTLHVKIIKKKFIQHTNLFINYDKWMVSGFSEFFESVDVHNLTILAKKTPFVFVVVNFNERKIVGSHFLKKKIIVGSHLERKKELHKNDYV